MQQLLWGDFHNKQKSITEYGVANAISAAVLFINNQGVFVFEMMENCPM